MLATKFTYLKRKGESLSPTTNEPICTKPNKNSLKPFRPSFLQNHRLLSHGEAVLGNLSELRHAPEVHLGTVLQSDDNVAPLTDETWHYLDILDHIVRKITPILTRQSRDNCHPQVGEPVPQIECP